MAKRIRPYLLVVRADKRDHDDAPATKRKRDEDVVVEERPTTRRPRRYRVLLHNDDYTTMEFVVQILMELFSKSRAEATQVMLHVHQKGRGVCGVFTREVAETKVARVTERAREEGHPLLCTMERDDG